MTNEEINAAVGRARAAKAHADEATPAPWIPRLVQECDRGVFWASFRVAQENQGWMRSGDKDVCKTDSAFIAHAREDVPQMADDVEAMAAEIERLHGHLTNIQEQVDVQSEDAGLWFCAPRASEAYLQEALRRLHEIIENETAYEVVRKILGDGTGGADGGTTIPLDGQSHSGYEELCGEE